MVKLSQPSRNSKEFHGKNSNNRRVPHRATYTQIRSWHETQSEGIPETQEAKILKFLSGVGCATSRQIQAGTGIERTAVTRQISALKLSKKVVARDRIPCEITGRIVECYGLPIPSGQRGLFSSFDTAGY